jgi:hypothetical protein
MKRPSSFRMIQTREFRSAMSAGFMIQSGEQPMRVDLRQETEPGDPVLEIPWSDPDRPACRYIDVKRHPEGAIELEECRRYPALGQFLLRVNSPESSFRTAKCDVWATSELELEERLEFAMPCKVGSYVDLMFERADLSSRCEPYKNLAEGLTQRLNTSRWRSLIWSSAAASFGLRTAGVTTSRSSCTPTEGRRRMPRLSGARRSSCLPGPSWPSTANPTGDPPNPLPRKAAGRYQIGQEMRSPTSRAIVKAGSMCYKAKTLKASGRRPAWYVMRGVHGPLSEARSGAWVSQPQGA